MSSSLERRTLLQALGLVGAAGTAGTAATSGTALARPAGAAVPARVPDAVVLDTMTALAVFVMPGPDPYSRAQGTPRHEPGAVEARLPHFLTEMLDRYFPLPLGSGGSLPLSPVVAVLLNIGAVRVDPRSLAGPFLSPMARLSFAGKAKVLANIEGADADLVARLDAALPEPLRRTASGLLRYLGNALYLLCGLGGYSEWAVFDPATKRLTGRPVGWQVSGYTPSADGWDDFRGYYQGRDKAHA
ncbi:hypothetical protein SMC26_45010 [Actinomadura fulvescens]|uniref:Gluconate 2-dehydrogenase subunit 3 family protein n=1 Tax=Actinomadura fulvescens TaxID=46160 RepID=A0ABP6C131_9ACTN